MEQVLLEKLVETIEKKNELELQFILVNQEYEKLLAAYRAYKNTKGDSQK